MPFLSSTYYWDGRFLAGSSPSFGQRVPFQIMCGFLVRCFELLQLGRLRVALFLFAIILLEPVKFIAEFEISRDLPRRQSHCIFGREAASDEGCDEDGDCRKRTLIGFASSSAATSCATNLTKVSSPFGNVSLQIAATNLI